MGMENKMQMVEISRLVPYVNNARTHSAAQISKLRASIREFGFINPVIIDGNYGIIAGHGRVVAAQEEGLAERVPAYVPADAVSGHDKQPGFGGGEGCEQDHEDHLYADGGGVTGVP